MLGWLEEAFDIRRDWRLVRLGITAQIDKAICSFDHAAHCDTARTDAAPFRIKHGRRCSGNILELGNIRVTAPDTALRKLMRSIVGIG